MQFYPDIAKKKHLLFLKKNQIFILQICLSYIFYAYMSLLIIFLTSKLSLPQQQAYQIMAIFLGSEYTLRSIAAYLINKKISDYFAITSGLIINSLGITGFFFMKIDTIFLLYFSLSLMTISFSLLQPGILILISNSYKYDHCAYSTVFTKNQAAINVGATLGQIISGIIYLFFNIKSAFFSIQIIVLFTVLIFMISYLRINNLFYKNYVFNWKNIYYFMIILLISLLLSLVYFFDLEFSIIMLCAWFFITIKIFFLSKNKKKYYFFHIVSINIICICFFTFFNQINGPLILFISQFSINHLYYFSIPVQWFSALECVFIIFLVLLIRKFSFIYCFFNKIQFIKKMALSLVLLGFGFFSLVIMLLINLSNGKSINSIGLLFFYFSLSCSELLFVPEILSYFLRISFSSKNLLELLIAYFFIAKAEGGYLTMSIAKAIFKDTHNQSQYLTKYLFMFSIFACLSTLVGVFLFLTDFLTEPVKLRSADEPVNTPSVLDL